MSKFSKFLTVTAVAAAMAALGTTAQATPIVVGTPITTPPPVVTATGDVIAVFAYQNAGDTSTLDEVSPVVFLSIFTNHPTPASGTAVDLGNQSGGIVFGLNDLSPGHINSYLSDTPDGDGHYHAAFRTDFSDFGVGGEPAGLVAYLATLPSGTDVTFVGWEDRRTGDTVDWDYNDLIFAFANVCVENCNPVPEPLTLSLFGAGLAGAAAFRRRRKT